MYALTLVVGELISILPLFIFYVVIFSVDNTAAPAIRSETDPPWSLTLRNSGVQLKLSERVWSQLDAGSEKELKLVLASRPLPQYEIGQCVHSSASWCPAQAFVSYLAVSGMLPVDPFCLELSKRLAEERVLGLAECVNALEPDLDSLKESVSEENHKNISEVLQLISVGLIPEALQERLRPVRTARQRRVRTVTDAAQIVATVLAVHEAPPRTGSASPAPSASCVPIPSAGSIGGGGGVSSSSSSSHHSREGSMGGAAFAASTPPSQTDSPYSSSPPSSVQPSNTPPSGTHPPSPSNATAATAAMISAPSVSSSPPPSGSPASGRSAVNPSNPRPFPVLSARASMFVGTGRSLLPFQRADAQKARGDPPAAALSSAQAGASSPAGAATASPISAGSDSPVISPIVSASAPTATTAIPSVPPNGPTGRRMTMAYTLPPAVVIASTSTAPSVTETTTIVSPLTVDPITSLPPSSRTSIDRPSRSVSPPPPPPPPLPSPVNNTVSATPSPAHAQPVPTIIVSAAPAVLPSPSPSNTGSAPVRRPPPPPLPTAGSSSNLINRPVTSVDSGILIETQKKTDWPTVAFEVTKVNERGRKQARTLRLTSDQIQNIRDNDTISSRHSYEEVFCVTLADAETLVISYMHTHDYTYMSPIALQIVQDINERISSKREKKKQTNLNQLAIKFQTETVGQTNFKLNFHAFNEHMYFFIHFCAHVYACVYCVCA
jgi:hypothetical protein